MASWQRHDLCDGHRGGKRLAESGSSGEKIGGGSGEICGYPTFFLVLSFFYFPVPATRVYLI